MTYQQIVRRGGFTVDLAAEKALPLFTPQGELDWADGWTFRRILGEHDREGAIFVTSDDQGREMIWRIQNLEPARKSCYYVVTPGSHTTEITVLLQSRNDGRTDVTVEYAYTPLTEAGVEFLRPITEESYRSRMQSWDRAIRHYLVTGTMLRHHDK